MRILIIMGGFFPGKKLGGPPVSVDNFCSLMKEHECYILTYDHDLGETTRYKDITEGWNDRGNCKVLYVSDSAYNKSTFEKVIGEIHPELLYLQGIFQSCVLPCLQLAKKHRIPVLLAPRGELCDGALNIRKWKKMPYIVLINTIGLVTNIHWQSTSEEETAAIKKLMRASDDQMHRLDNIPSIPRKEYSRQEKVAGEGRFVFLSRIHPKKNLLFAISLFKEIGGKAEFDIYGPIEDAEYWKQCQSEIERLPKNVKVEYKGMIGHDQVHEVFSHYDAFLFPTLSENYGHVIAESLIVGTPVIISDQTPWLGLENVGAGWDINLNLNQKFIASIQKIIDMGKDEHSRLTESVKEYASCKMNIREYEVKYNNAIQFIIHKSLSKSS